MKKIICVMLLFGVVAAAAPASAHVPVVESTERNDFKNQGLYFGSTRLEDPTATSQAVYGTITAPDEYDLYAFVPQNDGTVPIEVLVPMQHRSEAFNPSVIVSAKELENPSDVSVPFETLLGYALTEIAGGNRGDAFFEPFSLERYRHGTEYKLPVKKGNNYFIAVLDRNRQSGSYVLSLGSAENFAGTPLVQTLGDVLKVKSGLVGTGAVPWKDIIGLFLVLAGLIVALGAVTVIDIHGFLGRHSPYWTAATISAHKITKPLIWVGMALLLAGSALLHRTGWVNGVVLFQAVLIAILIANGLFLTFWVSPRLLKKERDGNAAEPLPRPWQRVITVSFVISFLCWWGTVFLLAWYLLV